MIETSVLIVGGGPVGMATAIELGWRGIDCTVIEQGDGVVDHPRLGIILTRTMEFCRRWGIADRVYNCGFDNDYKLNIVYCTSMSGHLLAMDRNPSPNEMPPPPQSPEKRQRCPQIWFNPLLEKAASEYDSVSIRHFTRLESLEQTAEAVVAEVTNTLSGARDKICAKYMVACDGAGSTVRQALNVAMCGDPTLSNSIGIFIRSPELVRMHDKGPAERYIFVGPQGTWANLTVVDGRELWRITLIGSKKPVDLACFDPHEVIAKCFGRTDIPYEIISIKPWRRTELIAEGMRHGRVFLAGDAAHTMSPTGGFGMSTGVGDSVDLGWKLEAVLKGWGGEHLLDSYDLERRPVATRAAAISANNFRAWVSASDCSNILDETPSGQATRERIGEHMLRAGREDWDSLGVQLGYRYESSSICVADGTPPPPESIIEYEQTSRPGSRAPHAWLGRGRSTLDLFGRGFSLLRFGGDEASAEGLARAAQEQTVPLRVHSIAAPEVAAIYQSRFVLVRPDGHVAWRGNALPADPSLLISAVRGALSAKEKSVLDVVGGDGRDQSR